MKQPGKKKMGKVKPPMGWHEPALLFITSSRGNEVEHSWSNPKFKEVIRVWLNPEKVGEMERKLPRGQHTLWKLLKQRRMNSYCLLWFFRLYPRHDTYSGPRGLWILGPSFLVQRLKRIYLWLAIILVFIQLLNRALSLSSTDAGN